MLNPNSSGNSANSFFSSVLLPEPEGPATTRGRGKGMAALFAAISKYDTKIIFETSWGIKTAKKANKVGIVS